MTLAELLAALFGLGTDILGLNAAGTVVVLPDPPGGTDWTQVLVQMFGTAGVTALVGFLAWRNGKIGLDNQTKALAAAEAQHEASLAHARAQQEAALANDRAMRAKDDVREILTATLDTVKESQDSIRLASRTWALRRNVSRDDARQYDWLEDAERERGLPDDFGRRQDEVRQVDAAVHGADEALSRRLEQLGLYLKPTSSPLAELFEFQRDFVSAWNTFNNSLLTEDGEYVAGPEYEAHRLARAHAPEPVALSAIEFGEAAGAYVRGS